MANTKATRAPRLYRVGDIFEATAISRQTIAKEFESGKLPGVKIRSAWAATFADLCTWLGKDRAEVLFPAEGAE